MTRNRMLPRLALAAFVTATATPSVAQTGATRWEAPRTADGRPDLQGVWANNSATPMERPEALADRERLTAEEQAELAARAGRLFDGAGDAAFGDGVFEAVLQDPDEYTSTDGGTGNYNSFWIVARDFDDRTSLVVDPPNGRIPLRAEVAAARAALDPLRSVNPAGPEEAGLNVRCISYGAPYLMAGYNSYFQILQTPDHVAIVQEMISDARIIPLTGHPRIDPDIEQWHGDSRGWWDGDTLVVETTNYRAYEDVLIPLLGGGGTEGRRITERYTRVGPDTLRWSVTFEDPATWTQPWTAEMALSRSDDALFEYACHEGNIGLEGMLAGTRQLERQAAER